MNDECLAFLDLYPNTKGQTVVVTKEHLPSDFLDISYKKFIVIMTTSKRVATLIRRSLSAVVVEGMEVNHIHVKLYPIYKMHMETPRLTMNVVYFDEYHGYLTTQHGPAANYEQLNELALTINSKDKKVKS